MSRIALLGICGLLSALAVFVWRARPDSAINKWFAAYTVLMSAWIFGIAGVNSGSHLEAWGRFTFASASLIPAAFLAFTRCYPTQTSWPSSLVLKITFLTGGAFALLSLTTPLLVYDVSLTDEGLSRKTGPLYVAFSVYFLVVWVAALGVFITKWRHSRGLARAQLQYLGAGLIVSGAGGIGTNLLIPFLTGRSTYSALGPSFTLILVALVGHAIIRHRLMDLRVVINRSLTYVVAVAVVSVAIVGVGRLFLPRWEPRSLVVAPDVLVIGAVAVWMLTGPGQRMLSRIVDPYLYRGRIEHSSALREATHKLSHLMQPVELAAQLQTILSDAFVPETFAMIARPLDGGPLEQLTPRTPNITDILTIATLVTGHTGPTVTLVNPGTETGTTSKALEALKADGVELVVTLGRRGQLLGCMLLGPRRSGDAYFTQDIGFIESLAELASIALENAMLYRQSIRMLEYSDRLLESLESAVVAIDVTGRLTSSNPAARSLLRVHESDRDEPLAGLPSEVAWALVLAVSGVWTPSDVEVTIDHDPRGLLPVMVSGAVLRDHNSEIVGALVVVTDLSTVKALERNQRRAEHFAMMARFYAGIAHEIRSPLAAISNFVSMLPDRFDDPEYRDTATRLLPIEVGRIVRLADRLRLMAPSEGGKLSAVSLSPLLTDIVAIQAPAAEENRAQIVLKCSDRLPDVLGDQGQLVQLFLNLIRNAIESMPNGGGVAIHCTDRRATNSVVVEVIDDGVGIDPGMQSKIFQPFFTTKPSGTGLGLSICREIADFHRARLTLFPRKDRPGTVARVEFSSLADVDDSAAIEHVGHPVPAAKRYPRT